MSQLAAQVTLMNVSLEIEMMVACARVHLGAEELRVIGELSQKAIDWDLLIALCKKHKVLPLVFQSLQSMEDILPPTKADDLEKGYIFENALHNLSLVEELFLLLELFAEKEIEVVPFKGPVLTESIMGDFTLRRYLDLDLFIASADAVEAVQLLLGCGYIPEDGVLPDADGRRFYFQQLTGVTLIHSRKHISLDLQWDISNRVTRKPMVLEDVLGRLEQVELNGKSVPSLPVEELLCYLCLHGLKHRWLSLDQVCCVAELIRSRDDIDWDYTWEYARKRRCVNTLLLGLFLARKLLDVTLPDVMVAEIEGRALIGSLGRQVVEDMFSDYQENMVVSEKFDSLILQAQDSLVDRFFYCLRVLFIPTKEDLRFFQFSELLAFLRYFLRPLRLFSIYCRRKMTR